MHPEVSPFISILFIALVVTVFLVMMLGLNSILLEDKTRTKTIITSSAIILGWLFVSEVLAFTGYLQNFSSIPPRFSLIVLPPFLAVFYLGFSNKLNRILYKTPPNWLINIQSFRFVVEIILWLLFVSKIIPVQMTFEGYNWDVFLGLSAPFVGFYFYHKKFSKAVLIGWNIAGLLLLINIIVISILSAPLPFRQFMNPPANTLMVYFPFVWLPGFLVPCALLFHILSIKQLIKAKIIL